MSEHEDGRELTGVAASNALANAMPRVSAIHKAQRELASAVHRCIGNRMPHALQSVDGYVQVRSDDFEALQVALEELNKARLL